MDDRNSIYEWMHEYIMKCLNNGHSVCEGGIEWRRLAFEMEEIRRILWMAFDNGVEMEMVLEIDAQLGRIMPPSNARDIGRAVCMLMRKKAEIQEAYKNKRYVREIIAEQNKEKQGAYSEPNTEDEEVPWHDDDQDDSDQDAFLDQAAREIRTAYEATARQLCDGHLRELREGIHRLTDEANKADVGYGPTDAWNAAVEGFYPRCYTYCQGIDPLEAEEFLRFVMFEIRQLRITDRETCLQAAARLRNLAGRLFDLLYRLASGR